MANEMLYVGFCRICGTGPLGLRVCGDCDAVVILCDECDAVWTDADLDITPAFVSDAALPCPHCESALTEEPSHWAIEDELQNVRWLQEAIADGRFELKRGEAFQPRANEPPDSEF